MEFPEIMNDPYGFYHNLGPDELRDQAAFWQGVMFEKGDPRDLPAGEYDWRFEEAFPIDLIEEEGFDWISWMQEEIAAWSDEGQPDRYADMMGDTPIREAVILVEHEGRAWLWDGYHRTGASALSGRSSIPAIIGKKKTGP